MKAKKVVCPLLVAVFVLLFSVFFIGAAEQTVYVSSNGADANSGQSQSAAVKTIERAFELLPTGGRIVFCGSSYEVGKNYSFPQSDNRYTISSEMTGSFVYSGTLSVHSDMIIENIRFGGSSTPIVVCNGNNVTFGAGIKNTSNSYIVGGANLTAESDISDGSFSEDYTIEINSGEWVYFFGGNRRTVSTAPVCNISADITVKVGGATFISTGTSAAKNLNNLSGMNTTTGDLNFIMDSGAFRGSLYGIGRMGDGGSGRNYSGNINIEINGGSFTSSGGVIEMCQEAAAHFEGSCRLYVSDSADIKVSEINSERVNGSRTMTVPSSLVDRCVGFSRVVYLSGAGNDQNKGTSASDAYKTLSHAVDALSPNGGTVIVCGGVSVSTDTLLAPSDKEIVITSVNGSENYKNSASLTIDSMLTAGSSITFDNIRLRGSGTLYAGASTLTLGGGTDCDGALNVSASSHFGSHSSSGTVILSGGSYNVVSAGSIRGRGASAVSDTHVMLSGASVRVLTVSSGNDVLTSSSVSVSSGTVSEGVYGIWGTDAARVSGDISVEIAGGTVKDSICAVAQGISSIADGSFSLSLLGGDISSLSLISGEGFSSSSLTKAPGVVVGSTVGFGSSLSQKAVYVCDGGRGRADGSSAENAYSSLRTAIEALGPDGGNVVVCGPLTLSDFTEPAHSGKVKLTSRYSGYDHRTASGATVRLGSSYTASGPVHFDDITVTTSGKTQIFFGNGHPIEFGGGVECVIDGSGSTYPYVFGATSSGTANGAYVRIDGGRFHRVVGGSRYASGTVGGDIQVIIRGGRVDTFVSGSGSGKVNGNITVRVDGGHVGYEVCGMNGASDRHVEVNGDITLYISSKEIHGRISAARYGSYTRLNGKYTCYINTDELDHVTEISGTDKIAGNCSSELVYSSGIDPNKKVSGTVSYTNPQISGADPWVIYHDGYYYMAVTRGSSVTIAKALTVAELGSAEPVSVWTATKETGLANSVWSPELHYFSAQDFGEEYEGWYLYIACPPYDNNDNFYRRCYALRALTSDPQGGYGSPVDLTPNKPLQIKMDEDNSHWNIGPSVFRINGSIYMTWTGREFEYYGDHTQNLNIAKMLNPYTLDLSTHAIICEPTETWEKQGATYTGEKHLPEVVEGATAVYGPNGEVYCIYSASGYWSDHYALAQLKYVGGDPCNMKSWVKSPQPIFTQNSYVYGPGHASYTVGHDGTLYFIYHGYQSPRRVGGRYIYVEQYTVLGGNVQLGAGSPERPSDLKTVAKNPMPLSARADGFDRVVSNIPIEDYVPSVPDAPGGSGTGSSSGTSSNTPGQNSPGQSNPGQSGPNAPGQSNPGHSTPGSDVSGEGTNSSEDTADAPNTDGADSTNGVPEGSGGTSSSNGGATASDGSENGTAENIPDGSDTHENVLDTDDTPTQQSSGGKVIAVIAVFAVVLAAAGTAVIVIIRMKKRTSTIAIAKTPTEEPVEPPTDTTSDEQAEK